MHGHVCEGTGSGYWDGGADVLAGRTLQLLYNLLFTSLPVILVAVFDQDLGQDFCMEHPQAYAVGPRGERFHRRLFWYNILDGVYQGTVCFLFAISVYGWSTCASLCARVRGA
jgi:phospholipid-translocating ATPase